MRGDRRWRAGEDEEGGGAGGVFAVEAVTEVQGGGLQKQPLQTGQQGNQGWGRRGRPTNKLVRGKGEGNARGDESRRKLFFKH